MQCSVFSETQYCSSNDVGMLRLGRGEENGTALEICRNNVWGVFCVDDSWDDNAAVVTCRQLGYETGGIVTTDKSDLLSSFNNRSLLHTQVHLFLTLKTHLSIWCNMRRTVVAWKGHCCSVVLNYH